MLVVVDSIVRFVEWDGRKLRLTSELWRKNPEREGENIVYANAARFFTTRKPDWARVVARHKRAAARGIVSRGEQAISSVIKVTVSLLL